jgi:hypothetical protein
MSGGDIAITVDHNMEREKNSHRPMERDRL